MCVVWPTALQGAAEEECERDQGSHGSQLEEQGEQRQDAGGATLDAFSCDAAEADESADANLEDLLLGALCLHYYCISQLYRQPSDSFFFLAGGKPPLPLLLPGTIPSCLLAGMEAGLWEAGIANPLQAFTSDGPSYKRDCGGLGPCLIH